MPMFIRKVVHDVEKTSNIYYLVNALIGALNKGIEAWQRSYDRRTAAIEKASSDQRKVDRLAGEIGEVNEDLKTAIQPKTGG